MAQGLNIISEAISKVVGAVLPFGRQDEDDEQIRDLKRIFEELANLKDANLDETDDKDEMSKDSMAWYDRFTQEAYQDITESHYRNSKVKQQIIINSREDYFVPMRRAGTMYTFIYKPVTEDLDYYDRYPLVLRMVDASNDPDSILGVNLHYMFPRLRRLMLLNVLGRMTGALDDENSRVMRFNREFLSKPINKYSRVCIRRYRKNRILGRPIRIPPEHWMKMIHLPTYHFVGKREDRVWLNSYRQGKNPKPPRRYRRKN